MNRIGAFSNGALFQRLAFLDRAERGLYGTIFKRAEYAAAQGRLPNADPQCGLLCAAVRDVREQIGRVEDELIRRRSAAALPKAA